MPFNGTVVSNANIRRRSMQRSIVPAVTYLLHQLKIRLSLPKFCQRQQTIQISNPIQLSLLMGFLYAISVPSFSWTGVRAVSGRPYSVDHSLSKIHFAFEVHSTDSECTLTFQRLGPSSCRRLQLQPSTQPGCG